MVADGSGLLEIRVGFWYSVEVDDFREMLLLAIFSMFFLSFAIFRRFLVLLRPLMCFQPFRIAHLYLLLWSILCCPDVASTLFVMSLSKRSRALTSQLFLLVHERMTPSRFGV